MSRTGEHHERCRGSGRPCGVSRSRKTPITASDPAVENSYMLPHGGAAGRQPAGRAPPPGAARTPAPSGTPRSGRAARPGLGRAASSVVGPEVVRRRRGSRAVGGAARADGRQLASLDRTRVDRLATAAARRCRRRARRRSRTSPARRRPSRSRCRLLLRWASDVAAHSCGAPICSASSRTSSASPSPALGLACGRARRPRREYARPRRRPAAPTPGGDARTATASARSAPAARRRARAATPGSRATCSEVHRRTPSKVTVSPDGSVAVAPGASDSTRLRPFLPVTWVMPPVSRE